MKKIFSSVSLYSSGTIAGLQSCISDITGAGAEGLFLLIGSQCRLNSDELPALFRKLPVPVIAAIFPAVIYEDKLYEEAILVCGLVSSGSIHLISKIDRPEEELREELAASLVPPSISGNAFLVLDGLSQGVGKFIACLFDQLGPDVNVIGGGCGVLGETCQPSIITAKGRLADAAILIFQSESLASSFQHGWKKIAGPFLVTAADYNLIHQINFQPALPYYQSILAQHGRNSIEPTDLLESAKHYPFGLGQLDGEHLVRDPISFHGDSIQCAGTVPTNAVVDVLYAEDRDLIDVAGQTASRLGNALAEEYETKEGLYIFLIDCVSRQLVLADDYPLELENIRANLPTRACMMGILSIGEIANSLQGNIQLLNKATVIAGLGK